MHPRYQPSPSAASLSIKLFEASRWRLRRTRQLRVCVFNRVLVLKWDFAVGFDDPRKGCRAGREGPILASRRREMRGIGGTTIAQTHFKHPGTPARVARQEKELTMSYPGHVAGCSGKELTLGAQSPPLLRQGHRKRDSASHLDRIPR